MQEDIKGEIWHKLVPNHKYRVWRKDYNGNTFYNIMVEQKNFGDDKTKFYIPITFKKGVEVKNETDIIIIKAIENLRINKNVEEKIRPYYPVFSYMITEFEEIKSQEQIQKDALDEFNDVMDDIEITSEDLPF